MWCVGILDDYADASVIQYFAYCINLEKWENLSIAEKLVIPQPERPLTAREDSSTGLGQIFAETAGIARNVALNLGLITGNTYNHNDWHQRMDMWDSLHYDNEFNIKMVTLNIFACAVDKGLSIDFYSYSANSIRSIFERYNGFGDDAIQYATECYEYYLIFDRYS